MHIQARLTSCRPHRAPGRGRVRRAGGGSRNQAAVPDGGWVVRREGGADFHLSIWVHKLGAVRLAGR